ncbi:hypothetical protein ACSBOB_00950 [Mesorhizobium sp. ASY16-5R]|uniref:hypothetical protein n=1 Tax=Mesorhizobium sp. ASY16-5R TaxID=3445772 RepID=UPI003F9EC0E7
MAAAAKFSLYHLFIGVASAVSLTLLGVLVSQMLTQAGTLGEYGARLKTIEDGVATTGANIVTLSQAVDQGFLKADTNFENLKTTFDEDATDPTKMIASMGLVEPGEVFGAVIYNNALWAFPASEAMAVRLQASGLRREQVNSALHGYKVRSISAVGLIAPVPAPQ